ncbi:MAG TPA: hypothetical protein VIY49_26675 [Bryobacteraceae bacterium]
MTAAQLIEQTSIVSVWNALGGGPLRHGRGNAFWRKGADSWSLSLNDDRGAWFDHRDGVGGGVLDLICLVRGGSRQEALKWWAEYRCVQLDGDKPLSPEERRRYAHARQAAPELARRAEIWIIERLEELETLKADALAREDFKALQTASREHHRMNTLKADGAAVVAEYIRARQTDPTGTAAMIAEGERWRDTSEALVNLQIAKWAREAGAALEVAA